MTISSWDRRLPACSSLSLGSVFSRAGWKPAIPGILTLLLLASPAFAGDAVKGKAGFARCAACHRVGEGAKNVVGPQLNGVVGRPAATAPDYVYSQAMKASGKTWDEASLRIFLAHPSAVVPGTKMTFAGIRDAATVEDVIAYLATFDAEGKAKP
ncbi:cytochrome c family protein [Labrys sp. ZIDIC5]|uniref:c-type cytochrome n=1 Tax=Labrys sedimenti TaxID=3106036 RepID=UPI002ACA0256|nr:cytochrome c family protein [Labrys sp. ZIDIC5]MDZ5449532.1 cytochrome c family protein [Labrys sp. ZIDIC5]